jgi:hypothetical protein
VILLSRDAAWLSGRVCRENCYNRVVIFAHLQSSFWTNQSVQPRPISDPLPTQVTLDPLVDFLSSAALNEAAFFFANGVVAGYSTSNSNLNVKANFKSEWQVGRTIIGVVACPLWPVSLDGKKMASETYKILGVLAKSDEHNGPPQ